MLSHLPKVFTARISTDDSKSFSWTLHCTSSQELLHRQLLHNIPYWFMGSYRRTYNSFPYFISQNQDSTVRSELSIGSLPLLLWESHLVPEGEMDFAVSRALFSFKPQIIFIMKTIHKIPPLMEIWNILVQYECIVSWLHYIQNHGYS